MKNKISSFEKSGFLVPILESVIRGKIKKNTVLIQSCIFHIIEYIEIYTIAKKKQFYETYTS